MVTHPPFFRAAHVVMRGFTLIEALVVLAILGILVTIAAPSLRDMVIASRVRSAASDLFESMLLARSEAIKRGTSVDIIPTGGDWAAGWTVQAGATVIQSHDASQDVTVTGYTTASGSTSTGDSLRYTLGGRLSTAAGYSVRRLSISTTASTHPITPRCVVIDAGGRASIKTDSDNDPTNGC